MADAVDDYLAVLVAAGRSAHTVRVYRIDLRRAAAESLSTRVIRARLVGLAPAARARRVAALRGFWAWARAEGLVRGGLRLEPTAVPAGDRSRAPRPDDVRAALAVIPLQADRDQLLFGLLATLGLRPGEALGLRVEDVDAQAGELHVTGWGGRVRRVLVDDRVVLQRLRNWLRTNGSHTGPLFGSPTAEGALRYQSVARRWARYAERAGVRIGLGDLRRAHSAELLAGGVPEWVVRERLGQQTGALPGAPTGSADEAITAWRAKSAARKAG